MLRRLLATAATLALLAPLAHAQSVDEVLAKHFEAQGGLENLKKIQSMRMTGKMTLGPGMEAPFTMERARPNLQRMDFTFSGMTGTQASDGKTAWLVMPFMGKKDPEPMPAEDAKQFNEEDFDGPMVDYKTKGHTVELLGKESVEGAECFKLKITRKDGRVETTWLDAETYLAIKTESKRKVRGTEMETESLFGDYKDVNGFLLAHAMDQGAKGAPQRQKMTFEKIEVNPKLDLARFTMPAPADTTKKDAAKSAEAKKGK
jgi:outer membrane lipoprotein-sorting protein